MFCACDGDYDDSEVDDSGHDDDDDDENDEDDDDDGDEGSNECVAIQQECGLDESKPEHVGLSLSCDLRCMQLLDQLKQVRGSFEGGCVLL